ncbi:MAG: formylglycine-generating enzyme family protein [Planctomycetes bacterium]|nr:formylglycine-generating enzyme family protein [Planctomycetota bacterium]
MWCARIGMLSATIACCIPLAAHAADVYDIDKRVEKAREAYEAECNAIVVAITREIDTRETAERDRAKPNLDKIKDFKSDRETLESEGKFPAWIANKYKTRQKKNSTTLLNVLTEAQLDYVRAKSDDKAESLTAEIERLKTDGSLLPGKSTGVSKTAATIPTESKWKGWPKGGPSPAVAPFDASVALQLQAQWAKSLKVNVDHTNSLGMKFRLIPPGEFLMGSPPDEIDAAVKGAGDWANFVTTFKSEAPQHKVVITRPFYVGVYEVTQSQYEKVMGTNPSGFSRTGKKKDDVVNLDTSSHPVESVCWTDAIAFCVRLSELEKRSPAYRIEGDKVIPVEGNGYRLPSEAEWEYMCRAGTTTKYWSGTSDADLRDKGIGFYWGKRTQPVGMLKPNPFGIYDVIGNVREWTEDLWEPTFYGNFKDSPAVNPRCWQSAGTDHVARGGFWGEMFVACRSAARLARPIHERDLYIGLRVTLPVSAAK